MENLFLQFLKFLEPYFKSWLKEIIQESQVQFAFESGIENKNLRKLNVQETAEFLGISEPTVYSKTSRGELPACKAPGSKRLFFFEDDLIAYLKSGRKKTYAEVEAEAQNYLTKKRT